MSILEETIARIQPLDTAAMQAVGEKLDDSKGLGHLRELLLRYAEGL